MSVAETPRGDQAAADYGELLAGLLDRWAVAREPLRVDFRALLPALSATERASHRIHPYPAKLLCQIPALFANADQLSRPGEVVLDPFCGSGTVLLEAQLAGRRAVGLDTNPLACLIAGAKTTPIAPDRLQRAERFVLRASADAASEAVSPKHAQRLARWYRPHVLEQLTAVRAAVARLGDRDVRRFFEVAFSATARAVSLADPRVSVPVLLRPERHPLDHWLHRMGTERLARLERVDVRAEFRDQVRANVQRLETIADDGAPAAVVRHDVRELADGPRPAALPPEGVDLVITSPPYLGAQKYVRASSLSLLWLDLVPEGELQRLARQSIGREHFPRDEYLASRSSGLASADAVIDSVREENPLRAHLASVYMQEMSRALAGIWSVMRPGGHLVLVAGGNSLCGRPFATPAYLEELAHRQGFVTRLALLDRIRSRGLMTRRNHSSGLIAEECVMLLEKPA